MISMIASESSNVHMEPEIITGTEDRIGQLSAHLEKVTIAATEQKWMTKIRLRKKLEEFKSELKNNRECGINPLLIFPEEIWIMIFGQITDREDLANCSEACQLFKRLVRKDKKELLFGKIFPLIYNKLKKYQIKRCRLVCQHWCSGVDKFLERHFTIANPPSNIVSHLISDKDTSKIIKEFKFEYKVVDSRKDGTYYWDVHYDIRKKINNRTRNPFIGRTVKIIAQTPERGDNNFFEEFRLRFSEFGKHIWHLTLTDGTVSLSISGLYSLCILSLAGCTNLRSFHLTDWGSINWTIYEEKLNQCFNSKPALPFHKHLETLTFSIESTNTTVFLLQDRLLEKYCAQLKRVQVHLWNTQLYHHFNWGSLRELDVLHGNSIDLINSLKQMVAPNLRQLSIRLDKNGAPLTVLIHLTHHFPALQHLKLKFMDAFAGFSDEEILNIPPKYIGSVNTTILELMCSDFNIDFNFLICFPFTKQLIIQQGYYASSYNFLNEDHMVNSKPDYTKIYVEDDPDIVPDLESDESGSDDDDSNHDEASDAEDEGDIDDDDEENESENEDAENEGQVEEVAGEMDNLDIELEGEDNGLPNAVEQDELEEERRMDEDAVGDMGYENESLENNEDESGNEDNSGGHDAQIVDADLSTQNEANVILENQNKNTPEQESKDLENKSTLDTDESDNELFVDSEVDLVAKSAEKFKRCVTSNFVRLSNYLPSFDNPEPEHTRVREVYTSNIWKILPRLQVIKACKPEYGICDSKDRWHIYTRRVHEWENTDKIACLKTRLDLVKRDMAFQQKQITKRLRRKLRERRNDIEKQERNIGKDPLAIFSQQIWTMILEHLTDYDEILSCAKTCDLFANIFKETKTQWLFPLIFPLLFNYLEKMDIFKCRQVCRKWSFGIENFLQNFFVVEDEDRNIEEPYTGLQLPKKPFQFEHQFQFPSDSDCRQEGIIGEMGHHNRNPFLGRTVSIILSSSAEDCFERTTTQIQDFLRDLGQHIWHLKISSNKNFKPITPLAYYILVVNIFNQCSNLRSLWLFDVAVDWKLVESKWEITQQIVASNIESLPKSHDHLEYLVLQEEDPNFLAIQDKILGRYSQQLKRLDVCLVWNRNWYDAKRFGRDFTQLRILTPKTREWLSWSLGRTLTTTRLPNLRKLSIRLETHLPKLGTVMHLTNHFPKLEKLDIQFTKSYPQFESHEIINLKSRNLYWSPTLKCLELIMHQQGKMSCNFLIYFPYLKRLSIQYSKNKSDEKDYEFEKKKEADCDSKKLNENCDPDFIQLGNVFCENESDNDNQIYSSKIWGVLARLEFLEFSQPTSSNQTVRRKVFSRIGYEHFKNR